MDEDKNNDNLNRRMMLRFRRALNHMQVKEVPLIGRRFTWTNGQDNPTMTIIDRSFTTPAWEQIYKDPILHAISSSISDHCPLLMLPITNKYKSTRFRFETFWTNMPGYRECVQSRWQAPTNSNFNHLLRLHVKLRQTAKGLRKWARGLLPQSKIAMAICREVIMQLDRVQEERQLTAAEIDFKKFLKARLLGLLAVDKARAKQKLHLTWMRKGDANTRYFQLMANVRKKMNYIHML